MIQSSRNLLAHQRIGYLLLEWKYWTSFWLNYSFLERNDGDEDLNLFFGLDLELNPEFSILLEYNTALNENDMTAETMSISKGGY